MDTGTCEDMDYTSVQEVINRGNRAAVNLAALHDWVQYAKEADLEYKNGTCKNVGARTWARTGGCTMCCCAE